MTVRENQTIPPHTEALGKAAIFVAVVKRGSFAAAGEALGMARSTVSDHIRSLESKLGVRLMERSTRKLRLTEEGELLYERMGFALDAWEEACGAFEQRRDEPTGTLRVTSPSGLAASVVAGVLCELAQRYSQLSVELSADDKVRDMLSERFDVAIRMAALGDSRLIARPLGKTPRIFVASPEFAASVDSDDLDSIAHCPWVGHSAVVERSLRLDHTVSGEIIEQRPNYRAKGSSSAAQVALTQGGLGIALMPKLLVHDDIARGDLVHVFPAVRGGFTPLFALYPARGLMPARTRVFIDSIIEAIEENHPH